MSTKLTSDQLIQARDFWYKCGRNLHKTAENYSLSEITVKSYCVNFKWVKWADEVDAEAADLAKIDIVKERKKLLKNCIVWNNRLSKILNNPGAGQLKINSPAGELDKLVKAFQELTGKGDKHFTLELLFGGFDALSDGDKERIIKSIRAQSGTPGRCAGVSDDESAQSVRPPDTLE